jgi:hypothetical protein
LAQNSGQGYQSQSLDEALKIAREKMIMNRNMPNPTGTGCNIWTCPYTVFFYPSIIVVGIVSGIAVFVIFIKSWSSLNKTRKNIR